MQTIKLIVEGISLIPFAFSTGVRFALYFLISALGVWHNGPKHLLFENDKTLDFFFPDKRNE